ncbi:7-cyano-7-deazaguanine synthase [Neorhizobium galegae]|uniref:7-cyano-7-deazaguanine synthase n=1 Tax=Rhizobium/Agrobacterium group TaxID=227290 RepID=UPI000621F0E6|nr:MULTISPECIES: 7-cyano-7-deazaguanine synthase [Rhizobium/Agrobacterium group]MCQ1781365.1 7-cyano-7-deazaguanine synthase [Neorhizobium galegae]MCQ1797498.1 7-cyano-7-deazaguanine synthase [Neorhizobium galegae]MEA1843413.1 7-cyano-7-deazaguanine synthase [Agrobacterium tumefaciens]CDZ31020.1 7-cyano-7-deazaguanine synthase [Neorhizobium galegae bv. officinalis]
MSIVTLVSGGLDSTLVAKLAQEEGLSIYPLFVDYGQRSRDRELAACKSIMRRLGLPEPKIVDLSGYGALIRSGLTDRSLHIVDDAFTPGRNMLFLLTAAAYAFQKNADAVSIGLLHEETSLFPDQTAAFLRDAEQMIGRCLGRSIKVLAPLSQFHKIDVVELARQKGIVGTYSCHEGGEEACGECIACNEFKFERA